MPFIPSSHMVGRRTLSTRDLITIGILSAIALVISFLIGIATATTIVGAFVYTAIASFFTAIVFLLGAARVRKFGTLLLMGTVVSLPGLTAGNFLGVVGSILGWAIADLVAQRGRYQSRSALIIAYVLGCTLQFVSYTLPLFLSAATYLRSRQDRFHLSETQIQQYLHYVSWPTFFISTLLTTLFSLAGALVSVRIIDRHFAKAGKVTAISHGSEPADVPAPVEGPQLP